MQVVADISYSMCMNIEPTIKSPRVYRFVEEYVKDRNGQQAAIRAGYAIGSAAQQASVLLSNPKVQALVEARVAAVAETAHLEAAGIVRHWVLQLSADPTLITRTRRLNCRHCWGAGHEYQWTAREYAKAMDDATKLGEVPPPLVGGFGFRFNADPNPDCPECMGEGHLDEWFADLSTLGEAERSLVRSVERTKNGLKIHLTDQDKIRELAAKWLGMFVEKKEISGPNGAPLSFMHCTREEVLEALKNVGSKF